MTNILDILGLAGRGLQAAGNKIVPGDIQGPDREAVVRSMIAGLASAKPQLVDIGGGYLAPAMGDYLGGASRGRNTALSNIEADRKRKLEDELLRKQKLEDETRNQQVRMGEMGMRRAYDIMDQQQARQNRIEDMAKEFEQRKSLYKMEQEARGENNAQNQFVNLRDQYLGAGGDWSSVQGKPEDQQIELMAKQIQMARMRGNELSAEDRDLAMREKKISLQEKEAKLAALGNQLTMKQKAMIKARAEEMAIAANANNPNADYTSEDFEGQAMREVLGSNGDSPITKPTPATITPTDLIKQAMGQ